ncbi:MAG: cyclopropane fatty acyl phospholipid synthase [Patescibacteria group bacterium]|jgi:cyclopropane-fatty-acyl-phospholipid synthase
MNKTGAKKIVQDLLALADVQINGTQPTDMRVYNENLYSRILAGGTLAVGEAYMDGWWDSPQLDAFFAKVLTAELNKKIAPKKLVWPVLKSKIINAQTKTRSQKVAKQHYDLGNDFYAAMLDKRLQYTCAYWPTANTLNEAQEHKLDLVCRKLQLSKNDTVLELGGGWGGFAKYAAEKYGCAVVSYNISAEQVAYAKNYCASLPVKIIQADYRTASGKFDKVVSIGMCEHIGYKNYASFIKLVQRCLKPGGLFLLHTIGYITSSTTIEPWFNKYIFPNGMLPSLAQLTTALEGRFVIEDVHNFGTDYDKTLLAWHRNFVEHWPRFKEQYGERFYRMWQYYLLSSAGSFRARKNQLWQLILSKDGVPGGYQSIR